MSRTAEHVSEGHPDKFNDQVADLILDRALQLAGSDSEKRATRTAIECLSKDKLTVVSGEVIFSREVLGTIDVHALTQSVWEKVGYGKGEDLTVLNHLRAQSADIAQGIDLGGAGDQGIMVGYATNEQVNGSVNTELMPTEYQLARNICLKLRDLRVTGALPWLRTDCKSQVTLDADGHVTNVIVAAQHEDVDEKKYPELLEQFERSVIANAVHPVVLPEHSSIESKLEKVEDSFGAGENKAIRRHYVVKNGSGPGLRICVNGTGKFATGGTIGDAGVVGRKIVVDAYGPQVPVGGGAYSGKDPTKVDRSAAYMARYIAKTLVAEQEANWCLVKIAYGIGRLDPEMFTVTSDTGDISDKIQQRFGKYLTPGNIIDALDLRNPTNDFFNPDPTKWSYFDTAAYGHYGREIFPWEQVGRLNV